MEKVETGRLKRCVYTTLIGNYEKLNEQRVAENSCIEFICLTDDAELKSETWQIRQVSPVFTMDPVRSQRDLKIRPNLHLPEFDQTLYIDNSVILTQTPESLFEAYLGDAAFAVPTHSYRATVLDEFLEVSRLGLDDQGRIFEQLNHYLVHHAEILEEQPYWSAILLRDSRDEGVRAMQEIWLGHVNRYARRDQLSMNLAFRMARVTPNPMPIDNYSSWFHSWPVTEGRHLDEGRRTAAVSFRPPVARIRASELELEERERQHGSVLAETVHAHEQRFAALQATLQDQHEQHERELAEQSRRHEIMLGERAESMLAEQHAIMECALSEVSLRHETELASERHRYEAALAKEQARYDALLASPSGRLASGLSRVAHRFPRLAGLVWRSAAVLCRVVTLQWRARSGDRSSHPR